MTLNYRASGLGNDHGKWIEFDLNVRTTGNRTWTFIDPTLLDQLEVGSAYVIGESESGITFPATLVGTRRDGYLVFDVGWDKYKWMEPQP